MTSHPHHALPPKVLSALSNAYTILVVDDVAVNRTILGRLLNRVGYRTFEAVDGLDAMEKLTSMAADLVVLDVEMPGKNGVEVTREFRKWEKETEARGSLPIIVASGNPTDEMEMAALDAGADVFLTKPFDFPKLLKVIRELLNSKSLAATRKVDSKPDTDRQDQNVINSIEISPSAKKPG